MAYRLRTSGKARCALGSTGWLQTTPKGDTTHPNGPMRTDAGRTKQARVSSTRPPIVPRTSPTRGYATADVIQIADEGLGYNLPATACATSSVLAVPPMS